MLPKRCVRLLYGVRLRSEARTQLPLSQAASPHAHHSPLEHSSPVHPRQPVHHPHTPNPAKAVAPMQACAVHLRDRTPNNSACSRLRYGLRLRSEERTQLPLSQAVSANAHHRPLEHKSRVLLGQPVHPPRTPHPAKAVAPMQACAMHLRDRTPKTPRTFTLPYRLRLRSAAKLPLSTGRPALIYQKTSECVSLWFLRQPFTSRQPQGSCPSHSTHKKKAPISGGLFQ